VTAPNQPTPDGAIPVGGFRSFQLMTENDAKSAMKGGVLGSFGNAQNTHNDQVKTPIGERPKFTQTPINMSLWGTMNPKEHSTVPRSLLISGTASGTATGGSGDNSHSHSLNRIPDYQPDGNNIDEGECGFIRLTRDAKLKYVGLATGDSNNWFGIQAAFIGVYSVNQDTGLLTLLTPTLAASDIKGQILTSNTEFAFDMGVTIDGKQDDVYAVITLQDTTLVQTTGALMCARVTKTGRWNGNQHPPFQYCYTDVTSGDRLPSSIPAANQYWNNNPMTVPFYFLREE